jgi:ABC-2 type transport system ATP-binding protein
MADNIAIKVNGVYKNFLLPHEKVSSVKSLFTSMYKKRDKSVESQHALHDISFEVKKGEFFGIVGRNGSGKSTLLKILAGIYQPTKGSVTTHGKLVPFIELGVGFNPELTGRENVFLNGAMLGFSRKEVEAMYDDIVAFAELERFMDQKLKNYSSGMQVRLAFSMATRSEADILLVDEVLAVGDADFQRKCFNYFRELKKKKTTVVFISHDMSAVREYCDRAIMIEQSNIVHRGTADDIATEYVKLFNAPAEGKVADGNGGTKDRWGDNGIRFSNLKVDTNEQYVTIDVDVKATVESEEPVFGYVIKDASGNDLIGSNSKILHQRMGDFKPGDTGHLQWKLPNVFNDGIFYLTIAVTHNDTVSIHDWWELAASFRIFREDKTPYALNPHSKVTLKR